MEQSFGFIFFLRKNKGNDQSQQIVYMRITVDCQRSEISTKRKCNPACWHVDAGRMSGKTDDVKAFNAYLDVLQHKVYEAKKQLIELSKPVTADNIKNLLLGIEEEKPKYMLLEIFRQHNQQVAALVGRDYAPGTLTRYETSYKHTRAFLLSRYKKDDIDVNQLKYEFITEYEFWLKTVRNCAHNSAIKYLANFRKIILRCLRNGWLAKDPFAGFSMVKKEVDRVALTENELQKLAAVKLNAERLSLVRDIFLFSCYSGLAYADVKKLKRSEVAAGIDGEKWIFIKRQKTDALSRIPLLAPAAEILHRYAADPQCLLKDRLLPILSNQKMNAYLKEIADLCGISKSLTYHIARHTFATTVTLSNGVPIETVAKMLGHRNLKTTQHYAKILDKKISDDMKSVRLKYS
ncbi:site-specific integrase [Ferruginibacter paludis]|uniref:site-specific integrase n=1 Tax=Ferruginibacter paludis TaxID=1310417 RepID=UPI0025B2E606|nr:site-specific integrase [Ferruginibacter paludis]MDN3656055.1 site-specific integrase [Ferruginibacter paludis]